MLYKEALPFVKDFVERVSEALALQHPEAKLSTCQKVFLSFCLMGVLVTNSFCMARFHRASLGLFKLSALSWMFRRSPIFWNALLAIGVSVVLKHYRITSGTLLTDDSEKKRAKITKHIYHAHKIYDKKTGGYINGQCLIFLVLVTEKLTIPVGFAFYMPDPAMTAYNKEKERLKKKGVPRAEYPRKPEKNPNYPSKVELASRLWGAFKQNHPKIQVKALVGDHHYSSEKLMAKGQELFAAQTIGHLSALQNVVYGGKTYAVRDYFKMNPPVHQELIVRGGEKKEVYWSSARLYVPSHGKKMLVIGIKYEENEELRYLCASDLSWRSVDVVRTWTLRWLIEVFIEDFKSYEGWGQLAKQTGEEGSSRGLTLSLLLDLCLLLHPSQQTCFENNRPAFTVGRLLEKCRVEALLLFLKDALTGSKARAKFDELCEKVERVFVPQPSKKHMSGRDLGRMEPTPSLKYKVAIP